MAENGNFPNGDLYFSCIRLIEEPLSFSFLATEQRLVHRFIAWKFKNKRLAKRALAGAVGSSRAGAGGRSGIYWVKLVERTITENHIIRTPVG